MPSRPSARFRAAGACLVALAEYRVDQATHIAEVGFAVRTDWQLKGVGTLLMKRLAEVAHARGFVALSARIPRENRPMLSIFHKSGLPVTTESSPDGSMVNVVAVLSPAPVSKRTKLGTADA